MGWAIGIFFWMFGAFECYGALTRINDPRPDWSLSPRARVVLALSWPFIVVVMTLDMVRDLRGS